MQQIIMEQLSGGRAEVLGTHGTPGHLHLWTDFPIPQPLPTPSACEFAKTNLYSLKQVQL
jgi:hypothetical protein